jgi:hypothetical protein
MNTPFDRVIADVEKRRYHNHRLQSHSDLVSDGIYDDIKAHCPPFREDVETGTIKKWLNWPAPGARNRKIDLLVSGADQRGDLPDLAKMRICIENKSVVTAHRNRDARFDDLNEALSVLHNVKPEAILVATVMIGTAERVLNVPDELKKRYKNDEIGFMKTVLPRLSSGDQKLWTDFDWAVSKNRPMDAQRTLEKFRQLPTRPAGHTHVQGYDFLLFVPVDIDNVNKPRLLRQNSLGIDIDREYAGMLESISKAYRARWHL